MSSQCVQVRVVGQQLLHLRVGAVDVLGIARQRGPAERPDAAAEQRPDIGRHEAREVEGVGHAFVLRHLADVVAVVDASARPCLWNSSMARTCVGHRLLAPPWRPPAGSRARGASSQSASVQPCGQIAVDRIVRRGLVGHARRAARRGAAARAAPRRHCRAAPTDTGFFSAVDRSMIASASSRSLACMSR